MLIFAAFVACKEPAVTFAETQPKNVSTLKDLPRKLYGIYYNGDDSTYLRISKTNVLKAYIDSDTIPGQEFLDTILALNRGDVIKKYRGYYFLNIKRGTDDWEVKRMRLNNGVLSINEISSEDEVSKLEEITESRRDTIKPFKVRPSKKQFKKFLKNNGFSSGENYVRVH